MLEKSHFRRGLANYLTVFGAFRAAFSGDSLRRIALALLCAMPLLLAGKATAGIGCGVIAALFLLHCACARDWAWLRAPDMRMLLVLWVYLLLVSLLSPAPLQSLAMAAGQIRFLALYAAMRQWLLKDEEALTAYGWCVLAAVALILLDAGWQYATGVSLTGRPLWHDLRLTGPLTHPNVGNLLLKLSLPAQGWMLYTARNRGDRRQLAVVLAVALATVLLIPLSGERSITVLLMFGTGVFLASLYASFRTLRRGVLWALAALVVCALVVSTQSIVQQRAAYFIAEILDFKKTYYWAIYIAAWHMWLQHPLFGVGVAQFWDACQPLLAQGFTWFCNIHAHNIYLHWLAETGIVGFVLFVAFAYLTAAEAWRGWRAARGSDAALAAAGGVAAVAVLFFPVIGTQNMLSNWPGALFWYTLGAAMAVLRAASKARP